MDDRDDQTPNDESSLVLELDESDLPEGSPGFQLVPEDGAEEGGEQDGGGGQRFVLGRHRSWGVESGGQVAVEDAEDGDEEGVGEQGGWLRAYPSDEGAVGTDVQIGGPQQLAWYKQQLQELGYEEFMAGIQDGSVPNPGDVLTGQQYQELNEALTRESLNQAQAGVEGHQQLEQFIGALQRDPREALSDLQVGDLQVPVGLTDQQLAILDQYIPTENHRRWLRQILQDQGNR